MIKEVKVQTKVSLGLDILWKSLTTEQLFVTPKMLPDKVKEAQLLEGDGGLGTIFLFSFSHGDKTLVQKEKIVELDETLHRVGQQVVEGGYLDDGWSFFRKTFQLTPAAADETVVDVTLAYELQTEVEGSDMSSMIEGNALNFVKSMESYLLTVG